MQRIATSYRRRVTKKDAGIDLETCPEVGSAPKVSEQASFSLSRLGPAFSGSMVQRAKRKLLHHSIPTWSPTVVLTGP